MNIRIVAFASWLCMAPAAWAQSVESPETPETAATSDAAVSGEPELEAASTPAELVEIAIDKVLAILEDPELKGADRAAERRERMRRLFLQAFDMDTVAALSLSTYRKNFSPEELAEFTDVYSRLLFTTYLGHIEKYAGEKIQIRDTREEGAGKALVATVVKSATGDILIDYSIQKMGAVWKAYDVRVEGVSLVRNYRTQFRETLANKPPSRLIEQLQKKVAENEESL